VGRRDVEPKHLDEPGQAGRLALGQVEHQSRQRGGVDDRVLEGALQAAPDQPCVEGVVAVLDQDRGLRETQERSPRILELRRPDQHGAVDVVPFARVRVDGRAAVDKGVEKREGALQREPLGADLEDEEGSVAGRLHIERHELSPVERRIASDLGRVDGDLLPRHRLGGAARLQVQGPRAHRASASARRAHAISSPLSARSSRTAAP
jgi:hypothetical protein